MDITHHIILAKKPSHGKMIEKANLIIWVGEDLETFLEKPLKSISKGQ